MKIKSTYTIALSKVVILYELCLITISNSMIIPAKRYDSMNIRAPSISTYENSHNQHTLLFNSKHVEDVDIILPETSTYSPRSDLMKSSILALVTMSVISIAEPVSAQVTSDSLSSMITSDASSIPSSMQEAISGFISGATVVISKTIIKYPLDTAAVRLQMPRNETSSLTIQELFQDSYKGIVAPLIGNVPAGAVFFSVKDSIKSMLKSNTEVMLPKWFITMIAVAVAIPPYWLLRNPTEVVKTRQQAKLSGYDSNAFDAYKRTWEEATHPGEKSIIKPLSIFYSGYIENMIYSYPADVIKFLLYEVFSNGNTPSPLEGAAYGAFSTAIAQFITTPLDVARNRIMTNSQQSTLSYWENLNKIAREEGIQGLFSGATPRIGKAFLSGAIQFAAYEETKVAVSSFFNMAK